MNTAKKFCLHCGKATIESGTNCKVCNLPFTNEGAEQHFLSGYYNPQKLFAVLNKGDQLGNRFIVNQMLGKGRDGTVYLANDTLSGFDVALKVIPLNPDTDKTAAQQLKRELILHSKIPDKTHIIPIYDIHFTSTKDGCKILLLSMHYAEGGTFRKWLIENRNNHELRKTRGLNYFQQACKGIIACHAAGIIHLDIKPENMLFSGGMLKISDFGTSHCIYHLNELNNPEQEFSSFDSGTSAYMSPEHFTASHPDELDESADIYSLGIILYELLNPKARPPFAGNHEKLRYHHLNTIPKPLPGIDEKIMSIVLRCLEKDSDKRYQSAEILLEAFSNDALELTASTDDINDTDDSNTSKNELWEEAYNNYTFSKLNKTKNLLKLILLDQPGHTQAIELMTEINDRYNEASRFYNEIESNLNKLNLEELIKMTTEAAEIYPNHPSGRTIQKKLKIKTSLYQQELQKGINALKAEKWEFALIYFNQVLEISKGDHHLQPLIDDLIRIKEMFHEKSKAICDRSTDKTAKMERKIKEKTDELKRRIPAMKGIN